jgi:hypothetical protein
LEEEEEANLVRKKEIGAEMYYEADLTELPQIPEGDPFQVERTSRRTMLRFERPMTNLELKKQYGVSQMDNIALYEENLSEYLKALTHWGASIAGENPSEAIIILEKVVELGGEFRDAYKLAADIYAGKGDRDGMKTLRTVTEKNHFSDPVVRTHILEYIARKESELK